MDTIFQIGKGGITEETCIQIANALEARELIKARVLENSGYTVKEAAEIISEQISCDVVACVGTKFVLYKESSKKKRIEL
jgi:RNA-binding protein